MSGPPPPPPPRPLPPPPPQVTAATGGVPAVGGGPPPLPPSAAAPAVGGAPAVSSGPPALPPALPVTSTSGGGPPPVPARPLPPVPPPRPLPAPPAAGASSAPPPLPAAAAAPVAASAPISAASGGDVPAAAAAPSYVAPAKQSVEELLAKDSADEALARYKASLLGTPTSAGGPASPAAARYPNDPRHIVVDRVELVSDGRAPLVLDLNDRKPFVLKEGASFSLVLHFYVQHEIVSGLRLTSSIVRYGITVDSTDEMLGSFAPAAAIKTYRLTEESAPSGFIARGSYTSTASLTDDDGKVHAALSYAFEIKKDWQ